MIAVRLLLFAWCVAASIGAAAEVAPAKTKPATTVADYRATPDGRVIMHYAVQIPAVPAGKRLGLIVGLHGNGAAEKATFYLINRGLNFAGLSDEYVVLGLKSKGYGWEDDDHTAIEATIAWALTQFPVDSSRVIGWGESKGAMCLGRFAPRHALLFAGVVQVSGNITDLPANPGNAAQDLPWYVMHGDADPVVPVSNGRDAAAALRAAGYPVIYREVAGGVHGFKDPITAVLMPDVARWMQALRNRQTPRAPADALLIENATKALQDRKVDGKISTLAKPFARLLELAGADVDALLALGLSAKDPAVRAGSARVCVGRLFGPDVTTALVPLIDDPNDSVRDAAITALGLRANFQETAAQNALIGVLTEAKRSAKDRSAALAQLAAALHVQRIQSNQDAAIVTALTVIADGPASPAKDLARAGLDGRVQLVAGKVVLDDGTAKKLMPK